MLQCSAPISLLPPDKTNITQLKLLNASLLPIHYSEKFYRCVLREPDFSRLAMCNDKYVGMVCCKEDNTETGKVLYIMTLGCLIMYRRRGVGSLLLEWVMELAQRIGTERIELHVHSVNTEAVKFYEKHQFSVKDELEGYYRYLKPTTAVLLSRDIDKDGDNG